VPPWLLLFLFLRWNPFAPVFLTKFLVVLGMVLFRLVHKGFFHFPVLGGIQSQYGSEQRFAIHMLAEDLPLCLSFFPPILSRLHRFHLFAETSEPAAQL
jgi:hypothetical protein